MGTSVTLENQKTQQDWIEVAVTEFLQAKRVENLSRGSLKFYSLNLGTFASWCDSQSVRLVSQVDANVLRLYFLHLEEVGRNAGGLHAAYRSVRAFLKWHWDEYEITARNPITKIKAPKVPQEAIQGVTPEQFQCLLNACGQNALGERDRAILMLLMDTGIRADELCSIKMEDVSIGEQTILITQGKGRNPLETARLIGADITGNLDNTIRIARTEQIDIFRETARDVYQTNSDIVSGINLITEPDACPICLNVASQNPWPLDYVFEELHPNCRCAFGPAV